VKSGRHDGGVSQRGPVREVATTFLRLGTIAFGGPVAHIAMMREELVRRRGWVSDERFVDLMSATNLIPGPNSTELAIHLGWDRARWRGLLAAGVCFILPAAIIVTALAWLYVEHGDTPGAEWVLAGVVPAVLAIVVWALAGLLPVVAKNRWLGLLAAAALAAYLLGVNELVVLVAGGVVAAVAHLLASRRPGHGALLAPLAVLFPDPTAGQLAQLFLTFLKIGSVLYGSGYVLLAFLEGDLVDRLGWVTQEQLVDAVSIGQVTPGPVFTTATFLGYLVAGLPGAFVATVGIFLPSFVFVGLLTRITNRLRSSAWTAAVLDGVNAASIALMAGVSWQLARASITDAAAVGIFVVTLVLLWRTRLNNAWYVAGGAVAGIGLGLSGLQ
jgi:chromate transporter